MTSVSNEFLRMLARKEPKMTDKGTYSQFNYEQMKLEFEITLLKLGCEQPRAQGWADSLLQTLRRTNQGTSVYFSKVTRGEQQTRIKQFIAEYNGSNRNELCEKFNISKRTSQRYIQLARNLAHANA